MSGSKQAVSIPELERIVVRAANAVPEGADVVAVTIATRSGSVPGRTGHDPVPPREWFVTGFQRRADPSPLGDEAVATALAEIIENLSRSYVVVG
jgi:hypothetical protein